MEKFVIGFKTLLFFSINFPVLHMAESCKLIPISSKLYNHNIAGKIFFKE